MRRHFSLLFVIVGSLAGPTWLLPGHSSGAAEDSPAAEKAAAKESPE